MSKLNREAWLAEAIKVLAPNFKTAGAPVPERVNVTCGWPSKKALSITGRKFCEVWGPETSIDGVPHVYISPLLYRSTDVVIALTQALMLLAVPEGEKGRKKKLAQLATKLDLLGAIDNFVAGPSFCQIEDFIMDGIGDYPHNQVVADKMKEDAEKTKDTNRQRKIFCKGLEHAEHEEYILRGSAKTLARGVPVCPVCGNQMEIETPADAESETNEQEREAA